MELVITRTGIQAHALRARNGSYLIFAALILLIFICCEDFGEERYVIAERIRRDEAVADAMVKEIGATKSTALIITLLELLREAGVRPPKLAEWVNARGIEFATPEAFTPFGLNLLTDTVESLPHVLLGLA